MFSLLLAVLAAASAPSDDCLIGAYRLQDDTTIDIGPGDGGEGLRWRRFDGATGALARSPDGHWTSTRGRTGIPDGTAITFTGCAEGGITVDGVAGQRIPFEVHETVFEGHDGTRLVGRLVLPPGNHEVPIIVLVHGAESYSAVREDDMQRQFPAEGVGAFVYDKRGTGDSAGEYTQDFSVLANDAVAAAREARRLAGARASRVGYRGGSQGGWVAPLAATRHPVDFVIVAYGLAVSVMEEDREAVILQMRTKGHGQDIIDQALEISDAAGVVASSGFKHGIDAFETVRAKYRDAPWYADVRGNFTHVLLPMTVDELRGEEGQAYVFGTPWHYDPRPVLRQLETPQLWILGEDDMDAPSAETLRRLHAIADEGAPITTALFPDAGHGMFLYETLPDGSQAMSRYAEGYMRMTLDFARDGRLGGAYGNSTIRRPSAPPIATVRVAFDRDGITDTQVQGLADKATGRRVTADDPVRVASISKLVTAIALMRLVEAGQVDLDADVGELLGWPLRNPAFPDTPITLRLLLSHRSSLTDAAGYWQAPLGGQVRDIADDPRAWDTAHAPGTYFRYTNLNFPLVAQVMERATGERFDRLMDRLVLRPLGIEGCFNWAMCSDATAARAVVLYDADGTPAKDDLHGHKPDCPVIPAEDGSCDLAQWRAGENGALFSPQGGLRISANGLARIGMMLLRGGELDGVQVLSPESLRALATPRWTYSPGAGLTFEEDTGDLGGGFFCRYGMAMQTLATPVEGCRDDPFGDGVARVGHSGSAYGLQSGLWLDRDGGNGVVWFVTGMPPERLGGRSAFSAVEEALAGETD